MNMFSNDGQPTIIKLPSPSLNGKTSVEQALSKRRSIREYKPTPLSLNSIAQLLWAAQGITNQKNLFRAAPSAGALYPLELYLIAGNVTGLAAGIYTYRPDKHELQLIKGGDRRPLISRAALEQSWVHQAAASIVICGVYARTEKKYGNRAERYVLIEVGAAAENIYVQATALGLGSVFVGAFDDKDLHEAIFAKSDEKPLGIVSVGKIK